MKFYKSKTRNLYFLDEDSISIQTDIKGYSIQFDFIELTSEGLLTLYKNYQWNGSTFVQDTNMCMRSSAFHDALCRLISKNIIPISFKINADKLYYNLCRDDGMSWIQAKIRYIGLRGYSYIPSIG